MTNSEIQQPIIPEAREFVANVYKKHGENSHFGNDPLEHAAGGLAFILYVNSFFDNPDESSNRQREAMQDKLQRLIFEIGPSIVSYLIDEFSLGIDRDAVLTQASRYKDKLLKKWGYWHLDAVESACRGVLMHDEQGTKDLLAYYHFGSRFMHTEAYSLCGVARLWPDFCYNPMHPDYVLDFEHLNRFSGKDKENLHQRFQGWVDDNRKDISRAASDSLGFNWEEIENY
jgi:hypothetical protein